MMDCRLEPGNDETMIFAPPVPALVKHFHAHKPARIWSLIVTLYGDAIVPRGGSLWIGSLIEIMELFGIDAGHVRTAISRLSSDGWLARIKRGRASYYRLSKSGEGEFLAATRRIYFGEARAFDGRVRVALLGPDLVDPGAVRRALAQTEFAALSQSALIGLADPADRIATRKGLHLLRVTPDDAVRAAATAAWNLEPVADAYRAFTARFSTLHRAAEKGSLPQADALVARTLLIHAFRRIVLRDPGLPQELLPADWPGREARALAGDIYRRLVPASEAFLSVHASNEKGPVPPPEPGLSQRFPL